MATFSAQEQQAFKYLFDLADTDQLGVLTGDKAVGFLSKSNLPIETLGEVWQISDNENTGFLTPHGFSLACRLIGHAQQGEVVSEELTRKPSQLPVFEGITIPGAPATSAVQPQNVVALAPVTVQDKSKFMRLFLGAGPVDGLLDGDKARDIFIKSNLPFDQLGHIWNLADTKQRGSLDATDFVIGMHLIDLTMSGRLPNGQLPDTLPAGFHESAAVPTATPSSPVQKQHTGPLQPQHSGSAAPRSSILKPQSTGDKPVARQHTGQKVSFGPAASASSHAGPTSSPGALAFARAPAAQPWDISSEEKARSDGFFDQLDGRKAGFVEGDQAVPFFLESRLPEATLAQIWDLSDISKQGKLSKDEFAVAMRLINDQLDGKPLPTELPQSLIPPSLRGGAVPQQPTTSAPQPAGVERDLFSLMDEPQEMSAAATAPAAPAPVQTMSPQVTGTRSPAPQAALSPQGTGNRSILSNAATAGGMSTTTPAMSPPPTMPSRSASTADDFFGDDGASKVNDNSVELGQLRNAYNASSRGVSTLTTQREDMEKTAKATSDEVAELKEKLRLSREAFDKEQKLVQDLSLRANDHKKELQQAKQQLITAESELSGLRVEKNEAEQALMRDKEEIRTLKAKLAEMSQATTTIKAEIEKLKKDGRQQKGMLAISKKQLATAEGDHEKSTRELEQLKLEPEASATAPAPATPEGLASAVPLPASHGPSQVASPAGSVRSTNPFDRFMTKPMSPQATGGSQMSAQRSLAEHTPAAHANGSQVSLPSLATGAAVGAVGAGAVGAGLLATQHSEQQPAASEHQSAPPAAEREAVTSATEEDPFAPAGHGETSDDPFNTGSPSLPAAAPTAPAPAPNAAFDDDFDRSFASEPGAMAAISEPSAGAGFDDAFTDFDQGATTSAAPEAAAAPTTGVAAPLPLNDAAGVSTEPSGKEIDAPAEPFVDHSAVVTDAATAPAVTAPPAASDKREEDAESSADEDNGPEDLDAPSRSKTPQMPGAFDAVEDSPNAAQSEPPSSVTPAAASQTSPAPGIVSAPAPAANDFDSDFVDLAPSSTTRTDAQNAEDNFDDDFNMDDFGSSPAATDDAFGVPSSSASKAPAPAAFDDAFGSDDFAPAAPISSSFTAPPPIVTSSGHGGFDDEFDSAFQPVSAQPAPAASPALADDSPAVQELTGMGFGRTAVAEALKNNGNDRQRALNALLDKTE